MKTSSTRWAFCVVGLVCAAVADSDGVYFDRVGPEIRPTIPYQRALVAFRGGLETMIVESVLNAPAGEYAWVVPLPSPPKTMEPATPGTLESAVLLTPPKVTIESDADRVARALLGLLAVIGVGIWGLSRHRDRSLRTSLRLMLECATAGVAAWVVGLGFFAPRAMDDASSAKTGDAGGVRASVQVLRRQTIGAYQAVVVKGADSEAILGWLRVNGFRVPAEAKPIMKEYVREGWCFMAAKLRTEAAGSAAPHPLKVTFDTPRAVYPMRLTAIAGSPVELDLFVVGEAFGTALGLDTWATGTQQGAVADVDSSGWPVPYYHPQLAAAMWDGAQVTRLRGMLRPADMAKDIWIRWSASPPEWAHVFRSEAATEHAAAGATWAFAILFALGIAVAVSRPGPLPFRIAAVVVVGALASAEVCRLAWPRNVLDVEHLSRANESLAAQAVAGAIEDLRQNPPGRQFPEVLRARISARYRAGQEQGGEKNEVPERDVPGGYWVEPTGRGWIVWYIGTEYDGADTCLWHVAEDGRPQGLTAQQTAAREAEAAQMLGLAGPVNVDSLTGKVVRYGDEVLEGDGLSAVQSTAEDRNRACAVAGHWLDRLGVESSRKLVGVMLAANPEAHSQPPLVAVAKYELGHSGFPVFVGGDKVEVTVDLHARSLLYFALHGRDYLFDAPAVRLAASRAQDLATGPARRFDLGEPLPGNLAKGGTPGYVRPNGEFGGIAYPLGYPQRLRLAWRMLFERGMVDIDAADGHLLGGAITYPDTKQPPQSGVLRRLNYARHDLTRATAQRVRPQTHRPRAHFDL